MAGEQETHQKSQGLGSSLLIVAPALHHQLLWNRVRGIAVARFDAERYGMLPFASSRQSNILTIEGTLTRKMARAARIVYDQMPEPKYVIALGACTLEGGIFWNSYNTVLPSDVGIPVDLYLPGCPTRPEAIARGLLMLQKKIRSQGAVKT